MNKLQPKDLNLAKALTSKAQKREGPKKKGLLVAFPIVLAGVCLLTFGGLQAYYFYQVYQYDNAMIAVSTMTGTDTYREAVRVQNDIDAAKLDVANAKLLRSVLDQYPDFSNGDFFSKVNGCLNGQITLTSCNYEMENATFLLQGTASTAD